MRYYIDEEFIEDGRTIDIVSIGIVAGDGRKLYLQSCEFDLQNANPWVKENVLPHLTLCPHVSSQGDTALEALDANRFEHPRRQCSFEDPEIHICGVNIDCPWRSLVQIRDEVRLFLDPMQHGTPELWGWCCSYDHVALCQLFGPMVNIPSGWPYHINDLQSILGDTPDSELPPQEGTAHHALEDALHIKRLCEIYAGHNNNV